MRDGYYLRNAMLDRHTRYWVDGKPFNVFAAQKYLRPILGEKDTLNYLRDLRQHPIYLPEAEWDKVFGGN